MKIFTILNFTLALLFTRVQSFEFDVGMEGNTPAVEGMFYLPCYKSDSFGVQVTEKRPCFNLLAYKVKLKVNGKGSSDVRLIGSFIKLGYKITESKINSSKMFGIFEEFLKPTKDFIFESVQEENVLSSPLGLGSKCYYFDLFNDKYFTKNKGNTISFCFEDDFLNFILKGKSDAFSDYEHLDNNVNPLLFEKNEIANGAPSFLTNINVFSEEKKNPINYFRGKRIMKNNELGKLFNIDLGTKNSFEYGFDDLDFYNFNYGTDNSNKRKRKETRKVAETFNIEFEGLNFLMESRFYIDYGYWTKFYIPLPVAPSFPVYSQIDDFINHGFKNLVKGEFKDFSFTGEEFVKFGDYNNNETSDISFYGIITSVFNIFSTELLIGSKKGMSSEFMLSRESTMFSEDIDLFLFANDYPNIKTSKKGFRENLARLNIAKKIFPKIEDWVENEVLNFKFKYENKSEFVSTEGYCSEYEFGSRNKKNCFRVLGSDSDGIYKGNLIYYNEMKGDEVETDEDEKYQGYSIFGVNVEEIDFMRLYDGPYTNINF